MVECNENIVKDGLWLLAVTETVRVRIYELKR